MFRLKCHSTRKDSATFAASIAVRTILLTILKYILAFGIAIVLLWWSFSSLTDKDIADIKDVLRRADYLMVLPVVAVLTLSHIFRALRWQQLILPLGYHAPAFQLFCGIMIGYVANQFIPRAGEIMRCTSISRYNKIPAEKLVGTIVAERAFDMVSLIVITLVTVFLQYNRISSYVHEIGSGIQNAFTSGATGTLIKIAVLLLVVVLGVWLYRKFREHRFAAFFMRVAKGVWHGLISIKDVKNKPLFLIYTILVWICYVFATWMGCLALKETAHLDIDAGLAMLVFGTFGIIVAPGGLGAYPIAIQKTLSFYHIPETIGLASGWLLWLAQFVFNTIIGVLAWFALKVKYGRK